MVWQLLRVYLLLKGPARLLPKAIGGHFVLQRGGWKRIASPKGRVLNAAALSAAKSVVVSADFKV